MQVEKLRAALGKYPIGTSPSSSSCSGGNEEENRSALDYYTGIFGLEKSRIMHVVNQAMEEVKKMATSGEPLWIRSFETGREILNYDEYMKEFPTENPRDDGRPNKRCIEASREMGIVFMQLPRLVQTFMDVVRSITYSYFIHIIINNTPSISIYAIFFSHSNVLIFIMHLNIEFFSFFNYTLKKYHKP